MRPLVLAILIITFTALAAPGCSPKKMGISRMADALSSTASTFSRDTDPEFVRLAAPSTLKMVEMLLDQQPRHEGLLMTACSGFTQYAYGFLQTDADLAADASGASARELRTRATAMYDRARDYCLRGLEVRHPGIRQALPKDAAGALASMTKGDVPALYWSAAAWGGSLSLADNPLVRLGELAIVRRMLTRALELDETWELGALHEAMIPLDGLPMLLGGSSARARSHFDRAVALSNGESAFAYLAMASSVARPAKDRAAFEQFLRAALAIDVSKQPSLRLANVIAQKRARVLLSRVNSLF
ncbi:MAG: TRAP transporter TatT component family protein [Acidobacteriota bacterium]